MTNLWCGKVWLRRAKWNVEDLVERQINIMKARWRNLVAGAYMKMDRMNLVPCANMKMRWTKLL